MNYELAKSLKDAGFPFKTDVWFFNDGDTHAHPDATLSELIEACGEDFRSLLKTDEWLATGVRTSGIFEMRIAEKAPSTEEAVGKLWLALNKKP